MFKIVGATPKRTGKQMLSCSFLSSLLDLRFSDILAQLVALQGQIFP
jgi:hypothetical protein